MKNRVENVRERFSFKLTTDELVKKGEEAAELNKQIALKEYHLTTYSKEKKAEINSIKGNLNNILKIVEAKTEEREVDAQKVFDFEAKKVLFFHDNVKMKERPMEHFEIALQYEPPAPITKAQSSSTAQ